MNQETAQLLQQIGIEKSDLSWTTQVVLILAILLVSYYTNLPPSYHASRTKDYGPHQSHVGRLSVQ